MTAPDFTMTVPDALSVVKPPNVKMEPLYNVKLFNVGIVNPDHVNGTVSDTFETASAPVIVGTAVKITDVPLNVPANTFVPEF